MRQLGKTYITLFGNTIEIDSNTSVENKVSVKAKAVTKVRILVKNMNLLLKIVMLYLNLYLILK